MVGHPDLIGRISQEIETIGPITFARFMELALYEPSYGYYMRGGPGDRQIGWTGDFYTSSDVSPLLAKALASQILQVDELLGRPDPFTILEMGPGKGSLAGGILAAIEERGHGYLDRMRYVLMERSPAMKALQRSNLTSWVSRSHTVSWVDSLGELSPVSVAGVMLSNELVDAFPVHRVKVEQGQLTEIYVDFQDGRFCERLQAPSTPELAGHVTGLEVHLTEGHTAEINLAAIEWMKDVARVLGKGVVITVDYGHTAVDLYSSDRSRGTLLCYHRHSVSEDPYARVGFQDMTAHVDFTSLAQAGESAGLQVTGFTNHMSFLTGLGIEDILNTLDPDSMEYRSATHLLGPNGMGQTFKILIQHKGMDRPDLDGLKFRPFFSSALTSKMSKV